ncbi:MAG: two-component sensor histidine kinase, partial [Burkholderiaceae bacterium]|nr:two-component sensor histidine kinase [Burkholderiaceae bacterium]
MKTLTLRIYLTVVVVLLLFAAASGWLFQRQIENERNRADTVLSERMAAWGDLIQRSLPGKDAPAEEQTAALLEWSQRLRLPLALDDAQGTRIVTSESFVERSTEPPPPDGPMAGGGPMRDNRHRAYAVPLEDGRTLWVMRPGRRSPPGFAPGGPGERRGEPPPWMALPFLAPAWQGGASLILLLALLFVAVSVAA